MRSVRLLLLRWSVRYSCPKAVQLLCSKIYQRFRSPMVVLELLEGIGHPPEAHRCTRPIGANTTWMPPEDDITGLEGSSLSPSEHRLALFQD